MVHTKTRANGAGASETFEDGIVSTIVRSAARLEDGRRRAQPVELVQQTSHAYPTLTLRRFIQVALMNGHDVLDRQPADDGDDVRSSVPAFSMPMDLSLSFEQQISHRSSNIVNVVVSEHRCGEDVGSWIALRVGPGLVDERLKMGPCHGVNLRPRSDSRAWSGNTHAGFVEAGTLWQLLDDYVVYGLAA